MFFRYVPNPTKVLAELLYGPKHLDAIEAHSQHGQHALDVVKGKVIAGDTANLDVLVAKGTRIDITLIIQFSI